jgi:hypothetical protein
MFSIPPTPTPMPAAPAAPLELPGGFGIWDSTDNAIGLWNQFQQYTPIVQIAVILAIVVAAIFVATRVIGSLNSEDPSSARAPRINVTVRQPVRRRRRR